ncbi:hypothetical protein ISN76_12910 [Dyella halodurans]|uniref:Uncharacterized protein n=1 Tax=Dyella halodurans TaxID=1920171 RepID=A0ABV9C0G6_9GAMM|nr:hypothetical protein [Dyella halodurans]
MPFGNFNTGKDVVIDVITPSGVLQLPATVTSFESKPIYNRIKSKPLNGINLEVDIPEGWEGSIGLDRQNSAIDDFFAQQELAYYAGQNVLMGTLTETIAEASGAISQYRYTNVSLRFDEAGKKTGDNKITQTIGFFASQRVKVS